MKKTFLTVLLLSLMTVPVALQAADNSVAIEALSRLKGVDLNSNPALKGAVLKVLEKTRGTPDFVKLVRQFKLSGQEEGLLEVAAKYPAEEAGIDAVRLLLETDKGALISEKLSSKDSAWAVPLATALGNTQDSRAQALLTTALTGETPQADVRKQCVRSLARTHEGALEILKLAGAGTLPAEAKFTATTELNHARWEDVKKQAAELLPLPAGQNMSPLPPVAELIQRQGNAAHGKEVFLRQESACSGCHRVGELGKDFGPALSEIGSKLGKDALYEAILDPSSGISFNYEAWEVTTKDGGEYFGIIVSETETEITMKDAGLIETRIAKANVVTRTKQAMSIMPLGLQMAMSTQDLVDLVEFLSSLKKPE